MHQKHVENERQYVKFECQHVPPEGSKWKKRQVVDIKCQNLCLLGHFVITLGSMWAYDAYMCLQDPSICQKYTFFQRTFNDFINPFGVTLGCLWGHFAHFGITLEALFGHFGITLGNERLFGSLWDHFGITFGM